MAALLFIILIFLPVTTLAGPVHDTSALKAQSVRTEPLTISEVLARIELTHPLLRAQGVDRMQARAKILKALGAWEPTFKNTTNVNRIQVYNFLYPQEVITGDLTTPSSNWGTLGASRFGAGSATALAIGVFSALFLMEPDRAASRQGQLGISLIRWASIACSK